MYWRFCRFSRDCRGREFYKRFWFSWKHIIWCGQEAPACSPVSCTSTNYNTSDTTSTLSISNPSTRSSTCSSTCSGFSIPNYSTSTSIRPSFSTSSASTVSTSNYCVKTLKNSVPVKVHFFCSYFTCIQSSSHGVI